jgi:hypothetical protein
VTPQVADLVPSSAEDFAKLIAADLDRYAKMIKAAGIPKQ